MPVLVLLIGCDPPAVSVGEGERPVVRLLPGGSGLQRLRAAGSGGPDRLVEVYSDRLRRVRGDRRSSLGSPVVRCTVFYLVGGGPQRHCSCTRSTAWFHSKAGTSWARRQQPPERVTRMPALLVPQADACSVTRGYDVGVARTAVLVRTNGRCAGEDLWTFAEARSLCVRLRSVGSLGMRADFSSPRTEAVGEALLADHGSAMGAGCDRSGVVACADSKG